MRVPEDVICKVCRKIFCCAQCRHKHEIINHAIAVRSPSAKSNTLNDKPDTETSKIKHVMCPICEGKPLVMHEGMYPEILKHIESRHLPLRCEKCEKVYVKIDDFKQFSKCQYVTVLGNETCETDTSKVTVTKQTTISTQTSPLCKSTCFNDGTPIPIINLQWKAKKVTQEEFTSDSASSIKNISSINNSSIQRSIGVGPAVKGKLVRTTSTPVHAEMIFSKPKDRTFNGSGGQVSSIYNSGGDSESSPMMPNPKSTPPKPPPDNFNRYLKVNCRAKLSTVTPLRQVMSKSIQKAFAEHGIPSAGGPVFNRKKMFDSNDSSTMDRSTANVGSPLDLRLSPVVRRSQAENCDCSKPESNQYSNNPVPPFANRDVVLSSKKLTTESIVITRTKHVAASFEAKSCNTSAGVQAMSAGNQSTASIGNSSVYKTCHSVEIITSTELSEVNIQQNPLATAKDNDNNLVAITPITRIPGAVINKKIIKFETPIKETEVFFTPNSTPTRRRSLRRVHSEENGGERNRMVQRNFRLSMEETTTELKRHYFSPQKRPALRECAQRAVFNRVEDVSDSPVEDDDDEVFVTLKDTTEGTQKIETQPVGRLWSLMSSVMQLGRTQSLDSSGANSIIRRCASIAGSLVRAKPLIDAEQLKTLKRKRTNTMDNQSAYLSPNASNVDSLSPNADCSKASTKRFRIQGRKPIERMRNNS